jgi:chemotaxis protein CheD
VIQGEFKVSDDPNVVLSTILGSCVAACMRDPVGGRWRHESFSSARPGNGSGGEATRYGVHLMELLINGLLKKGARRERIEAKIIGGAKTIAGFSNVGEKNAEFAHQFLTDEGIRIVGSNTGGDVGRKLEYFPVSGRAGSIRYRCGNTEDRGTRNSSAKNHCTEASSRHIDRVFLRSTAIMTDCPHDPGGIRVSPCNEVLERISENSSTLHS